MPPKTCCGFFSRTWNGIPRLLSPELKTRGTGAELVSLTYRCVTVTAGRNIWVKLPVSPAAYHLIMEPTHASRSLSLIGHILIGVTSHWSIFTPPILLTGHWSHFHSGQFSSLFIGQNFSSSISSLFSWVIFSLLPVLLYSYWSLLLSRHLKYILIGHILHIFSSHWSYFYSSSALR
jgi:hypothetical protein